MFSNPAATIERLCSRSIPKKRPTTSVGPFNATAHRQSQHNKKGRKDPSGPKARFWFLNTPTSGVHVLVRIKQDPESPGAEYPHSQNTQAVHGLWLLHHRETDKRNSPRPINPVTHINVFQRS